MKIVEDWFVEKRGKKKKKETSSLTLFGCPIIIIRSISRSSQPERDPESGA